MPTFSIILNIQHFRAQTICDLSVLGLVIRVSTLCHFSLQIKKMRSMCMIKCRLEVLIFRFLF